MKLYKTTAVIWTDYDPAEIELSELARESETGDAYCSHQTAVLVDNPEGDEHPPDLEFFGSVDELVEAYRSGMEAAKQVAS